MLYAATMEYPSELQEGRILRRYNRFFADVETPDGLEVAHVPNTGSLKGALMPGAACRFSRVSDPSRKLKLTLQQVQAGDAWVGVNTSLANVVVFEAFQARRIHDWRPFKWAQREAKINAKSRLDLAFCKEDLSKSGRWQPTWLKQRTFHLVEIKSVTMAQEHRALFPDAETTRGQKHLEDLLELRRQGHGAEILFLVQREDCQAFSPADAIDPIYGKLLRKAHAAGVSISAYPCELNKKGIWLKPNPLPIILD